MANAGRVELDLVAVGKDQVSAMLRQVDSQLRKTAGEMKTVGDAATKTGSSLDDLKGKASGVNKVREVFENLRSNAFFVVGAVTGVVGAVVGAVGAIKDFIDSQDEAAIAAKRWAEQQQKTADAIKKAYDVIFDFDYTPAETALAGINKQLSEAERAARALKDDYDALVPVLRDIAHLRAVQSATEAAIARDQERQANALARIIERTMKQHQEGILELGALGGPFDDTPEEKARRLAEAINKNPPRRGGGGPRQRDQRGDFFGQTTPVSDRFAVDPAFALGAKTPLDFDEFGGAGSNQEGSPLQRMATDAEKVRDALGQVGDAVTDLAGAKFPELVDALHEVHAISEQLTSGQATLGEALASGATAIAANAAKAVGGVRAEAAVRAAYEVGMGFATLANPVISAGHFTAGALLGAVAAGAGGGGGGSRSSGAGGGSSRGESSGSSGPSTVVYNFSTLVTDRQQVTTAINQAQRSSRGTGASSRSGV